MNDGKGRSPLNSEKWNLALKINLAAFGSGLTTFPIELNIHLFLKKKLMSANNHNYVIILST